MLCMQVQFMSRHIQQEISVALASVTPCVKVAGSHDLPRLGQGVHKGTIGTYQEWILPTTIKLKLSQLQASVLHVFYTAVTLAGRGGCTWAQQLQIIAASCLVCLHVIVEQYNPQQTGVETKDGPPRSPIAGAFWCLACSQGLLT